MREYTNLSWPEGPFGADRRPFGKPAHMIAAFALDWTDERLPAAAAAVYLRIKRAGELTISAATLNPGLVAVAGEDESDPPRLVAWLDRGLIRARRHAAVLAGHDFATALAAARALTDTPLAGLVGVAASWTDRTKERGMARMLDTAADLSTPHELPARLSTPLAHHTPDARATLPRTPEQQGDAAIGCLVRCLAIGLAAAWDIDAYRWSLEHGPLDVAHALTHAAWDTFPPAARPPVARAAG